MKKLPKIFALLSSIAFIIVFVIFIVLGSQVVLFFKEPLPKLYYGIFGTLGAVLALFIFLKIEGKSFKDFGMTFEKRTVLNWSMGVLTGTIIFMLMILTLVGFGGISLNKVVSVDYGKIALSLIPILPLALMEEIGFRTYPFLKLKSRLGVWHAQFIIALLFAIYHILMGWSVYIAFMGPFIWSLAFGWSALWTQGIAMPFGFHLALNVMQNLAGMKNEASAIYKIVERDPLNKELLATTEYLGLGMHLVVLIAACFLTHRYIRSKKSSTS